MQECQSVVLAEWGAGDGEDAVGCVKHVGRSVIMDGFGLTCERYAGKQG